MKRVVSVLLAVMMVVVIAAGCQKDKNVEDSKGKVEQQSSVEKDDGQKKQDKSEPITIKVVEGYCSESFPDGQDENNNVIIDWIRENSGYNVQMEMLPKDGAEQKVTVILASGDVPDLIRTFSKEQYYKLSAQGAFYDISEYINEQDMPDLYRIVPKDLWKPLKVNGKIYAMPIARNYNGVYGIYTRIDVLESNNLKVPSTLEEYYNVMKQLSDKDNKIYGITNDGPLVEGFTGAFGIDPDWKEINGKLVPTYIQPEGKKYLEYMKKLYDEGILDNEFVLNKPSNVKEKMISGTARMGVVSWWNAKTIDENLKEKAPEAKVEYIKPPVGENGEYGFVMPMPYGRLYSVPKGAKHPFEAVKLINFVSTQEAQEFIGFGMKGKHYNVEDGVIVPTTEAENIRFRVIYQWQDTQWSFNNRVKMKGFWSYFKPTTEWGILDNPINYAPAIKEYANNNNKLTDFVEENYSKFIIGDRDLSEFDNFVKEYLNQGGQESIDAVNEWYKDYK